MKIIKTNLVLLFLLFFSLNLGASNNQKIYPLESSVYRHITNLYLLQGKALPSTTGPYSQDELLMMFEKINYKSLPTESERELYQKAAKILNLTPNQSGNFGYDLSLAFNAEAYVHTNTTDFISENDWSYSYTSRKPLARVSFETFPTNHFYSYFEITLQNSYGNGPLTKPTPNDSPNPLYGQSKLTTNIIMLPPNSLPTIDLNFPYRAFVSAGGDNWSAQIGRDKISWGAGKTGNISVSNNMPYQQIGKFTTYFDRFKYTLLSSFFTHPQILDTDFTGKLNDYTNTQDINNDGIKMFLAHRVEFRFLQDKASLTLTESVMYQSSTGSLDLRFLNPVGFYHNQYIRGNSNSMLVIEGDITPVRGLNIYGQLGIDEIAFADEPTPPKNNAKPSAFAYILGIQHKIPLSKGVATIALEGVFIDSFFYLREKYDVGKRVFGVGFDGIVRVLSGSMKNLRYTQGYPYGGDVIAGNLLLDYEKPEFWGLSLNTLFMAHGVQGITSTWELYDGTDQPVVSTPSTENPFDGTTGSIEYTLLFSLDSQINITEKLTATARLDLPFVWNKNNVDKSLVSDYQINVGINYRF